MVVIILLILALVCFIAGGLNVTQPNINWVPVGLAFLTGALLAGNLGG